MQQNILLKLIANTNKNLKDNIEDIKVQNIDEHALVDWESVKQSVEMAHLGEKIKRVEMAEENMKRKATENATVP